MISVTAQAVKHNGKPGLKGPEGVANKTPFTTISLDKTWNIVIMRLDGTNPMATFNICKLN